MTTALLAIAWLIGAGCAAWGMPGGAWAAASLAVLPALAAARRRWAAALCIAAVCAGVSLLAVARWASAAAPPGRTSVARLIGGGPVRVDGVLTNDGEERERSQRLRVAVRAVDTDAGRVPAEGGLLVRVSLGRPFYAGDVVELEGLVTAPAQLEHFDYRTYLARQGIDAQVEYPRLRVTGHEPLSGPSAWLLGAQRAGNQALDRSLPQPEAALARGIVLGDRAAIPQSVTDDFNRSGTSHLIAISGYNITLVAAMTLASLTWLIGRRWAAGAALAVIATYAVFVGLSPSVVRALAMGALLIGTSLLGRPGAPWIALALAAALMTAQDPRVVDDVGFQLSFTATAGIMLLEPLFDSAGRRGVVSLAGDGALGAILLAGWQGMAVTLAATAATLPVLLHAFGRLSLVAPLANLLLVPLFPTVIVTSGLAALAGAVAPGVTPIAGAIAWLPLTATLHVAHIAAAVPGASLDLGRPTGTAVLAMYLAGGAAIVAPRSWEPPAGALRPAGVGAAWATALAAPALVAGLAIANLMAARTPDGRLTVTYFEAGGAPVALVTGPGGERVLVDTGPTGSALARALDPLLPARDRRLTLIMLTRRPRPAAGGLAEAVGRYRPRAVGVPGGVEDELPDTGDAFPLTLAPGMVLELSRGARLELHASAADPERLDVTAVWGTRRIALTPDSDGDVRAVRVEDQAPGTLAVTVSAVAGVSYEVRRDGPVRVSTDGERLRLQPAHGPLLPAADHTVPVVGGTPTPPQR